MQKLTFYAAIQKGRIDKKNRIVYGIAQIEDSKPDLQGDIVDFKASIRAFNNWSGNVREMHESKAVGRKVAVIPLLDKKAILVGVRISRGAEDTWQKVLDGTLSGFSIGGESLKKEKEYHEPSKKSINRIKDYRLDELSLVDSPANPGCRITLVTKRNNKLVASEALSDVNGGTVMKGHGISKTAKAALRTFAATATDGEELVLVKKSDLSRASVEGKDVIVLKSDGVVSETLKKEEFGDELEDNDEGDDPDEELEEIEDLSEHAKNLLDAHDAMHDLRGEECNCREEGEDEEEPPAGEQAPGAEEYKARRRKDLNKHRRRTDGARTRTRRRGEASDIEAMVNKAVGGLTTVVKGLAAKVDAIGTGAAPVVAARRGGGVPVLKLLEGGGAGTELTDLGGVEIDLNAKPEDILKAIKEKPQAGVALLEKALAEAQAEGSELAQKRDGKMELTPAESLRLTKLQDQIPRMKFMLDDARKYLAKRAVS